jgi:hypothetical protein
VPKFNPQVHNQVPHPFPQQMNKKKKSSSFIKWLPKNHPLSKFCHQTSFILEVLRGLQFQWQLKHEG